MIMKTRKIITSIFISVLTVTMYGQLAFIDGHSRFSSNMSNLDSNSFSGDGSIIPVISKIITDVSTEVVQEELVLESWMSEPFFLRLTVTGNCGAN